MAEYDALPEVGHACGHNVISAAAVGAGRGRWPAWPSSWACACRSSARPAEEGGGARSALIDAGVLRGRAHLALMVHPGPSDVLEPQVLAARRSTSPTAAERPTPPPSPSAASTPPTRWSWPRSRSACCARRCRPATACTASSPRRRGAERHPGAHQGRVDDPRRLAGAAGRTARALVRAASRPARWPAAGAELASSPRPTPRCATTPTWPPATGQRRGAGPHLRGRRPVEFDNFSTDIGNVSPGRAGHPSGHRHRLRRGGQPPAEFAAAAVTPAADQAILDGAIALAWTAIDAATDEELRDCLLAGGLLAAGASPVTTQPARRTRMCWWTMLGTKPAGSRTAAAACRPGTRPGRPWSRSRPARRAPRGRPVKR
jgi:hypothetical protein